MLFSRKFFAALLAVAAVSAQLDQRIQISYCSSDLGNNCNTANITLGHCELFGSDYAGPALKSFDMVDRCDVTCHLFPGQNCTGTDNPVNYPGRRDLETFPELIHTFQCDYNSTSPFQGGSPSVGINQTQGGPSVGINQTSWSARSVIMAILQCHLTSGLKLSGREEGGEGRSSGGGREEGGGERSSGEDTSELTPMLEI